LRVSTLSAVAAQFGVAAKPPPVKRSVALAGSYSGSNGQNGNGFTLYVAPGGATALNITDLLTGLTCTPSSGLSDHLRILRTAIQPNGSFTVKATHTGLYGALAARFNYTVRGRFQGGSAGKAATAAGTWREDVVSSDPATRCTSNDQSWSVTREAGPVPQKLVATPGSYSGSNGQNGNGFSLSVAPDGKSLLNVTDPLTGLACVPSSGASDHLQFVKIPIGAGGSFNAKVTQDGVLSGVSAKFTYTVSGYVEGTTSYGAGTIAGTWREDIAFASGVTKTCTSNEQMFTVTRSG
jgi:hypothetical protein